MVNGNNFPLDDLSALASYLNQSDIYDEKNASFFVTSATVDENWREINLTLKSSFTVDAGPHWFEMVE